MGQNGMIKNFKTLRESSLLPAIVGLPGLVVCALSITGFFGLHGWMTELTSHFRLQYAGSLALAAIAVGFFRKFRAAALFAAFSVLNLAVIAPLYFGGPASARADAPRLKILQMNVRTENEDYTAVRNLVLVENPDVLALDEVDDKWLAELASVTKLYPFQLTHPRNDNFGIALFSRVPWTEPQVLNLGHAIVESLSVKLSLEGRVVTVLCTHPLPPGSPATAQMRNDQLAGIAQWVRAQRTPVMVIGDLNTTPWSPYFQKLLTDSGLQNSAQGYGLQTSWPANYPLLAIPIDHCLLSPDLVAVARRIGPDLGSDHYPLIVVVAIASHSTAN